MIKKLIVPVLIAVLFVVAVVFGVVSPQASVAHAMSHHHSIPNAFCTSGCGSDWQWGAGSNHGLAATLSDPSVVSVAAGYVIDVDLEDCDTTTCSNFAHIGLEAKGNSTGGRGECPSFSSGLFYYYDTKFGPQCFGVPSADHGHPVTFQESFYSSNGGGTFFKVNSASGEQMCPSSGACFISGVAQTYNGPVTYNIEQYAGSGGFTTNQITQRDFTSNEYQSTGTGTPWNYVHTNPGTNFSSQPPYSNWLVFPSNSTTGGNMFYCDEASSLAGC